MSQVNGQTTYKPGKSTTAKLVPGSTWSISYVDGSGASGTVYNDTVTIGGLVVTSQAVEIAKAVSGGFTADPDRDGVVGLAFSNQNRGEYTKAY